jgi:hypothetical protein
MKKSAVIAQITTIIHYQITFLSHNIDRIEMNSFNYIEDLKIQHKI